MGKIAGYMAYMGIFAIFVSELHTWAIPGWVLSSAEPPEVFVPGIGHHKKYLILRIEEAFILIVGISSLASLPARRKHCKIVCIHWRDLKCIVV